jgi:hypothetical protein
MNCHWRLGLALGGALITGCPGDDGVSASTETRGDDSSGAAPSSATLPDPSASSTTPAADDSTGTPPAPEGSSSGGSDTGEPATGSESSTGGGNTATPCQGAPLVYVPDVTRVAAHVPAAAPASVGDLQGDLDPIEGGSDTGGGGFIGFIEQPDGGVDFECDPIEQDCPEGEKCMPWANDGGPSWNATRCSPIAPDPGAPGDSCTVEGSGVSGIDDCELGAMCFGVDPMGVGTCIEMCSGSAESPVCETPATTCVITNEGALALCQAVCNPLATECAPNEGCYLVEGVTVCVPDASGRQGGSGEPCEYLNACDDGTACVGASGVPGCAGATGCCSPFCTIGDDSTCLRGQTCVPLYEAGSAPLECVEEVGLCTAR